MSHEPLVLVGNAKSGTISVLRLGEEGLVPLADPVVGIGCGTFAVDGPRSLVYSAVKDPSPAVVTLALDRSSGDLREVARREVDDALAYLALAREGSLVLGASYHGGWATTWPVQEGALADPLRRIEHANLHCIVPDAAGHYAYAVSLGEDCIAQCSLDAAGSLVPLAAPVVRTPSGSGPRHLILSADEYSAYVVTEFTGEVIRFERDPATGQLSRAESVPVHDPNRGLSVSRYGADPRAEHLIWGADVHLGRFGAFLLATERTESTIAVVKTEPERLLGGLIGLVETVAQPRGFAVGPDEHHVVVAGEASGEVALYELSDEGVLTESGRLRVGEGPNWVRFA